MKFIATILNLLIGLQKGNIREQKSVTIANNQAIRVEVDDQRKIGKKKMVWLVSEYIQHMQR